MDNKCAGCTCERKNKDHKTNDSEQCTKLIREGKYGLRKIGCDVSCPQCQQCKYETVPNKNSSSSSQPLSTIDRKAFLEFLDKQMTMNDQNNKVYGIVTETEKKTGSPLDKLEENLLPNNLSTDYSYQENNIDELMPKKIICSNQDKVNCSKDKGCTWNEDSIICEDLHVDFYGFDKTEGEKYSLKVGNYDLADINNFDFSPEYLSVPQGLRVKIWHKEGYVGLYDAFLGNHEPKDFNEKYLYKIKNLGSIQICNMKSCKKPSPYSSMKLVNIMDGNNVDRIDNVKVSSISEYRDKLRKNIINRIKYIRKTQHECLPSVINYLRHNGINLHKNFDQEDDINRLQKIKFLLINIPSCKDLEVYKKYRNMNEEKRIRKIITDNCIKDDDSGECQINSSFSDIKADLNSIMNIKNNEIDNEMLKNIKNELRQEIKNEQDNLGPSPSETIISEKNNLIKNLNYKIFNLEDTINNYAEAPVETKIVYKQAPAETKIVYQQAPAETKIVYKQAPAETKIVYKQAPAETKIVYKHAPAITKIVKEKVVDKELCNEINNDSTLFGHKVKNSPITKKLYLFTNSAQYKSFSLVIIGLIIMYIIFKLLSD